ncbi:MAG: GT4 family glycosyltransferase PelF [Bdellovibrio sp.]
MSDVCLILEGTYPYVTGGVSSCVYQLIKNTPQIKYSILYIGASEIEGRDYKYPIPDNVSLIREVFLFDYNIQGRIFKLGNEFPSQLLTQFHREINSFDFSSLTKIFDYFFKDSEDFDKILKIFQSQETWDYLVKSYNYRFSDQSQVSFIDYFYTWRFTHYPVMRALSQELPRAKLYHSLSTGYAGAMGVAAKLRYNRPFILTEHGIYSHEREIEILQAEWIYNTDKEIKAMRHLSFFKEWWIHMFHFLSRMAYHFSDSITTLNFGNRAKQVQFGASFEKIKIIPNGIKISDFEQIQFIPKNQREKYTIGLIGRVVPIKDIKTFLKAISIVVRNFRNIEVLIVGPWDEDEAYYQECLRLMNLLELENVVHFTGKMDVKKVYNKLDLLVLSSISEGQPMVILEAFACKIPVVATDVGSCRELINGSDVDDRQLGEAGRVVPFGMPEKLANAILELLKDDELRLKMGQIARERVEKFYQEEINIARYYQLYGQYLGDQG